MAPPELRAIDSCAGSSAPACAAMFGDGQSPVLNLRRFVDVSPTRLTRWPASLLEVLPVQSIRPTAGSINKPVLTARRRAQTHAPRQLERCRRLWRILLRC